jgi:hypothetical protein
MMTRYAIVAGRIRAELPALALLVNRAEGALDRAKRNPQDQDYYLAAAALDMHSFYAGIERLLQFIANEIEGNLPSGPHWHQDLLAQMSFELPGVRPAVLSSEMQTALTEYLSFRHVVRNVYTFHLDPERVAELVTHLRPTFDKSAIDFNRFAEFLDQLADTPPD